MLILVDGCSCFVNSVQFIAVYNTNYCASNIHVNLYHISYRTYNICVMVMTHFQYANHGNDLSSL